jgi:hypothetical protein
LHIIGTGNFDGVRGWDRTNINTNPGLWHYSAGYHMAGLASKSTTTWFLGGRLTVAEFIRFHFETPDTAQLTYVANSNENRAVNWFINTAFITSAPEIGSIVF